MAKITLSIPDMMCAHCEKRIRGAIEKIGGKLLSLDPENKIIVLEDFLLDVPKTSKMVGMSTNLKLSKKNSLIVLPEQNKNIYLSSRNLQGVEVVTISDLNTYNIMKASTLVLTESAVDVLQSTL